MVLSFLCSLLTVVEEPDSIHPMGKRGQSEHNKSKTAAAKEIPKAQKLEIFDFWKLTFNKTRVSMDVNRENALGWAIYTYGLEACRHAILGCASSAFHMGQNKAGKTYNGIDLIFRDAEHVEMFLERYDKSIDTSARDEWINNG